MKTRLSMAIPAALSAAFLSLGFTSAQAGPMGFDKSLAANISASDKMVTKIGKRNHRSRRHRGNHHKRFNKRRHFRKGRFFRHHHARNRRFYRRRYSNLGLGLGFGFGSFYPSYYYGSGAYYDPYNSYYGPGFVYPPAYAYGPGYSYPPQYEYRGSSKAADRILDQLEQDTR